MKFKKASSADTGIKKKWLNNFIARLDEHQLSVNSVLIMKKDKICLELYNDPINKNSLQRMFSITKSFVSIAIGFLIEDGKISIDDRIVDFFPDKQPENGPFPYTEMMTIRNMLEMRTCHSKTTYKFSGCNDWTGSFFTTQPEHVPGTCFAYDTSSAHVLCALVEKLTGMNLLDYLRLKCLNDLGFSKEAFILKDPSGTSMGGSGLCATTRDILTITYFIAHNGNINGRQYLNEKYIKDAKSLISDTYGRQNSLEEMQGYGYMIWQTRYHGFVLYGMGGQLALYMPDEDLYMIITADTQGRQGGVQLIYESFYDEIYKKVTKNKKRQHTDSNRTINEHHLFSICGKSDSSFNSIYGKHYLCDKNSADISQVSLFIDDKKESGCFSFIREGIKKEISFGINKNISSRSFAGYNFLHSASGAWRTDDCFLIKIQITDIIKGNIYIILNFKNDYITVTMRKFEESNFDEFNCCFSGHIIS